MRNVFMLAAMGTMTLLTLQAASAQQELQLWPDGDAANAGDGPNTTSSGPARPTVHYRPSMLVYLPGENATGAGVMVCPGGGYSRLAMDHEGTQVAEWLNARGIAAFILKYRCGGGENAHPAPLADARRGMQTIRSRADEWEVDPARIGVMGFSAGGHLASSVSTLFESGDAEADDPVARQSSRPDFSILVYPVITMDAAVTHGGSRQNLLGDSPSAELVDQLSTEKQVSDETPPTILLHASDDQAVPPENALRYYRALLDHSVPAELHMYERGGHGFGMRTLTTGVNGWLNDLDAWLLAHDFARRTSN